MSSKQKKYSAQEKLNILRRHFIDGVAVSDLCEQAQINPVLFYRWRKELFESPGAFQKQSPKEDHQLQQKFNILEGKLKQKNEVIAELMEEYIRVKKNLGEI